jgi:hypothetical protein
MDADLQDRLDRIEALLLLVRDHQLREELALRDPRFQQADPEGFHQARMQAWREEEKQIEGTCRVLRARRKSETEPIPGSPEGSPNVFPFLPPEG